MQKGIDICICTFNRVDYLRQCVEKLIPQLTHSNSALTIIDNNSADGTKEYALSLMDKQLPIRYLFEPCQGLSNARNKAYKESGYEWIFYIDDDCLPSPNILEVAEKCISVHPEIDAVGGPIYPVFSSTPPSWLPTSFGEFKMTYDKFTIVDKGYIRGGNFLIRKSVLENLGGFKTHLGVMGNKIAYGEEIELQDRMHLAGYKTGYEPALIMGHFVRVEKLNPAWILHSEYARRRDKMLFDRKTGTAKAAVNLLRTVAGRVIWTPIHLVNLLFKKRYTYQNAVIDIFNPLAYRWGEFVGTIKRIR